MVSGRCIWRAALALAATASEPAAPLRAEDEAPVTREEHEKVIEELARLRAQVDAMGEDLDGAPAGEAPAAGEPRDSSGKGGIFDKPYLRQVTRRAHVGGYFDVEFRDAQNADHEFRFHRFVPSIHADIHERVRFASEIEIEDGAEVEIEFAFLDLLIFQQANLRGGVILDPLGKFNLIHDSPINDLTDRPLVDQFVIPTTLREIGVGLFGDLTPPDAVWEVKYEAYLTSGFKGLSDAGVSAISSASGLRNARPSGEAFGTRHFDDNDNSFAGVGRLSVSPLLGSEVGVSAHHGTYDEDGENDLTLAAIDVLFTIPQFAAAGAPVGPLEVLGEGSYAFIERNDLARAAGVPADLWGYYVQVNCHFMPAFLVQGLPQLFNPESTFTLVGRWDQVDLDGNEQTRTTVGINFRPVESAAIKFDYQFNRGSGTSPDAADDDAFLISLASYF